MNKTKQALLRRVAAASALVVGSTAAMAQEAGTGAIDVAALVTKIEAQLVPIGLIGLAILGIVVAVKAFKWVRASMS